MLTQDDERSESKADHRQEENWDPGQHVSGLVRFGVGLKDGGRCAAFEVQATCAKPLVCIGLRTS